jgi:hypothetical protein
MLRAEADGLIERDESEVVAQLADGWTVRRLARVSDYRRESLLMRNCVAMYVGDQMDSERPGHVSLEHYTGRYPGIVSRYHDANAQVGERIRWGVRAHMEIYSLRDANNVPHASMWAKPGERILDALGISNHPLADPHVDRLNLWTRQQGIAPLPYSAHLPVPAQIDERPEARERETQAERHAREQLESFLALALPPDHPRWPQMLNLAARYRTRPAWAELLGRLDSAYATCNPIAWARQMDEVAGF